MIVLIIEHFIGNFYLDYIAIVFLYVITKLTEIFFHYRFNFFSEFPSATLYEGIFLQKSYAEAYVNTFLKRLNLSEDIDNLEGMNDLNDAAYLGVNISERKSETKRTKKRESTPARDEMHTKAPYVICSPGCCYLFARVRNWYYSTSCRLYTDFARGISLTRAKLVPV